MISAANQGNRRAIQKLAELPTLPLPAAYLWEYFNELHPTRDNYGWGATKLKYREIKAWADLRQVTLDPWELEALLRLDNAYLGVVAASKESS